MPEEHVICHCPLSDHIRSQFGAVSFFNFADFQAPHFSLVKEALIEIGCVVTSLVVGWLSRACTVAKRCILGL